MSTPTANEVVSLLSQLGRELAAKQLEISRLDEDAVRARARYEVKFSRTFLEVEGAMDVRKHRAVLETESQKLDAEIAEQKLRAAKEAIRVLRDRLDIGRSLNSAIKAEFQSTAVGQ